MTQTLQIEFGTRVNGAQQFCDALMSRIERRLDGLEADMRSIKADAARVVGHGAA